MKKWIIWQHQIKCCRIHHLRMNIFHLIFLHQWPQIIHHQILIRYDLPYFFLFFIIFSFSFELQFNDESEMNNEYYNDSIAYLQLMRHSTTISSIYCIAYTLVFGVGLIGNLFVISVVFRVPRMRTVTNLFIANLAFADVLVIIFCVPATLMSNLFVRKYLARYTFINI